MATAAPALQAKPLIIGGARFQNDVLEWCSESKTLFVTVTSSLIFMWAIYSEKLPAAVRWQLSTSIGRLLLLVLLYIVHMAAGWIPAILFSIAIALTWANRPLQKPFGIREGFHAGTLVTEVGGKNLWFVEKVLKEHPQRIVQDRVTTQPVQEDSTKGSGRTSK
jgi:hypothetical protein